MLGTMPLIIKELNWSQERKNYWLYTDREKVN